MNRELINTLAKDNDKWRNVALKICGDYDTAQDLVQEMYLKFSKDTYNDYTEVSEYLVALVIRNIGTQIKPYDNINEKLPFEVDLGVSQLVENAPIKWHITLENVQKWPIGLSNPSRLIIDLDGNITEEKVTFMNDLLRHVIIGAELFPKSIFNLRLGYSFRRGEELRIIDEKNFSGLSFGFGIKFNKLRFNYSHARYSSASNISFLGLQIDLN